MNELINKASQGFSTLKVNQKYKLQAINFLKQWLSEDQFQEFRPQIIHLIEQESWDYLLDSFYQVIPFGTGGRRGEVGIGPNRINQWTIQASAQGHAQYLRKKYKDEVSTRGVVFAYDVREFVGNTYFNNQLPNPVLNLTSRKLAESAAEVYAANGIKVFIFEDVRTTPELSFAIRFLNTAAGVVFSASHNPPNYNGKKIYDEYGGQLIPPDDEALVIEVTKEVTQIKRIDYLDAVQQGLIQSVGNQIDEAYIKEVSSLSISQERNINILFTPMHGCGESSVAKVLTMLGFTVKLDPKTSNPSGHFENITFNIPNPEVVQSFETTLTFASNHDFDIILSSDPDADRIGLMVKHQHKWHFVNGNDIAAILMAYVVQKRKPSFKGNETAIKTMVTTDLVERICQKHNVTLYGDLLIGFKYVGDIMNKIEQEGHIDQFLIGMEESHGYIAGNYARDKDAAVAAIWLAEVAAEMKARQKTLIDYLHQIYLDYGYFNNYITEIRMLGATGKEKIDTIQKILRTDPPKNFGKFIVGGFEDYQDRLPIVSETDRAAKDIMVFKLKSDVEGQTIKVTIRPSGTEPKIKMYFEIGSTPNSNKNLDSIQKDVKQLLQEVEKAVMLRCYEAIGVNFPERGFLLFWQLPLDDKLKYFEIEPEIEQLQLIKSDAGREQKLNELLKFLGSNPIQKVEEAFKAKHHKTIYEYLNLTQQAHE